jgi:uncharacterized repeat protein (TIGR01451 family)
LDARSLSLAKVAATSASLSCEGGIDLLLVIGSSGSIALSPGAFEKIQRFATNAAGAFSISPAGARLGVVDFSGPGDTRLLLGLSGDAAAVNAAIGTMPFFRNSTDIAGGLNQAREELSIHGRPGVNHVIILLTDGKSDDGPAAEAAAVQCGNEGVQVFCIGVTAAIDAGQLQRIASAPSSAHVFTVEDFDGLSAILQQLIVNVCPSTAVDLAVSKTASPNPVLAGSNLTYLVTVTNHGPGTASGIILTDTLPPEVSLVSAKPSLGSWQWDGSNIVWTLDWLTNGGNAAMTVVVIPSLPLSSGECQSAIDVLLVMDSSGSIALSPGAFGKMQAFAKNLVTAFNVNPGGARFGLVDFSGPVDTRLILGLTGESVTIGAAIDNMPFFRNSTDMAGGLATAQAELEAHGRAGVNHVIVLVTDGRADDGPAALFAAANSKAEGTEIFTVGITDSIDSTVDPGNQRLSRDR